MSSSDTNSEFNYDSEDSEICFIPEYDMEVEDEIESAVVERSTSNESLDEMAYMYADEPLADEEWLKTYNEEVKENEDLERMLQKRLDGTEHVDSW